MNKSCLKTRSSLQREQWGVPAAHKSKGLGLRESSRVRTGLSTCSKEEGVTSGWRHVLVNPQQLASLAPSPVPRDGAPQLPPGFQAGS